MKRNIIIIASALLALCACGNGAGYTPELSKEAVSKVVNDAIQWQKENMPDAGRRHYNPKFTGWADGVFLSAVGEWTLVDDSRGFRDWLYEVAQENEYRPAHRTIGPANDIAVSSLYLNLYGDNPTPRYVIDEITDYQSQLEELRGGWEKILPTLERLEFQMSYKPQTDSLNYNDPRNQDRWCWIDALYMAAPVYAEASNIVSDGKYRDFMNQELWKTVDYLYSPEDSLFFRDSRFFDMSEPNGKKVFWGRGNGWAIVALARVIERLPADYPDMGKYVELYSAVVKKLASLQGEDGFWHTSLLDPESYPNPETSATGFCTYALWWGINRGILDRDEFLPKAVKGWEAMVSAVQKNGMLGWVQPIGDTPEHISADKNEVYGTAAFALAGAQIMKYLRSDLLSSLHIPDSHPRLVLSMEDIETMKANVASGAEPWKSAWENLRKRDSVYFKESWAPQPYNGDNSWTFYERAISDGEAARDCAIAYLISGDVAYAAKSLSIIEAWSNMEPASGHWFDPEIRYPNTGMQVARASFGFMYAYDLLCIDGSVPEESCRAFEDWVRVLLPHIKEGAARWAENDYFDKQYYQNHIAADVLGTMAVAITTGDEELLRYAVDSPENQRDARDVIEGCILMNGQQPYYREPLAIPTCDGEIIDRYRHYVIGGQYQDYKTKPNRALQYCGLTSSILMLIGEMGRLNGVDLYSYVAPEGENLILPMKYYAQFYISHESGIKSGLYAGENDFINRPGGTANFALWELANCRWPGNKLFETVLSANDRTDTYMHLVGPATLTHGRDINNQN